MLRLGSIRSGFDEAVSPSSIISSTVDLRNRLTSSGAKLECFGSIFSLVHFLLMSTAAVSVRPGTAEQSVIAGSQQRLAGSAPASPRQSLKFNVTLALTCADRSLVPLRSSLETPAA